ncbi:hypothetical protein JCM11641_007594 [Rhodosporidiobolus odoratus]
MPGQKRLTKEEAEGPVPPHWIVALTSEWGQRELDKVVRVQKAQSPEWVVETCWRKRLGGSGRPTVNLGTQRLRKDDYRPEYAHLANFRLDLFALNSLARHEECITAPTPRRDQTKRQRAVRRGRMPSWEQQADRGMKVKLAHLSALTIATDSELDSFATSKWHVSHRCHDKQCFRPEHLVIESSFVNSGREQCRGGVPCRHTPPCLVKRSITKAGAITGGGNEVEEAAKKAVVRQAEAEIKKEEEAVVEVEVWEESGKDGSGAAEKAVGHVGPSLSVRRRCRR